MKKGILPLLLICFLYTQKSAAQSCLTPTFVKRNMWLYNSEGKVAGNQDSVISKEYFNGRWIDLQSEIPFKKSERFYCVFEAKGAEPRAYFFNETKLPQNVVQKIMAWNVGGTLTFFVEEFQGEVRKISAIRFILE